MQNTITELRVYNAHTGKDLPTNPYVFQSYGEFKEWVAEQFDIPMGSLLLLTTQGQRVKESTFHYAGEIYAFDRLTGGTEPVSNGQQVEEKSPYDFIDSMEKRVVDDKDVFYENNEVIKPIKSPLADYDIVANKSNYRLLVSVITTNSSWSTAVLSDAIFSEKSIHESIKEISAVFKSLNITSKYLDNYYNEIHNKFKLSNDIITNLRINSLNDSWETYYYNLEKINLFNDNQANLTSIVSYSELESHAQESKRLNVEMKDKSNNIEKSLDAAKNKKITMEHKIEVFKQNSIIKNFNNLNLNDIVKHIRQLTKAVQAETKVVTETIPDYQHLKADTVMSPDQRDQLIKTVTKHQQVYVPEILQLANDLYYLQLNLIALFKKLKVTLAEVMEKTTSIQGNLLDIKSDMKVMVKQIDSLQVVESAICTVIDLPLLYGLFLLENVRRIEWETELKEIVEKTNENFALINDREVKYRKKWEKSYGLILRLLKLEDVFTLHNLLSVDLTTNKDHTIKELTLNVKRDDVVEYISTLKRTGVSQEVITLLQNGLEDLNNQKVSLYSKFDGYLNFNITRDANSTDNELLKSYQTRIKKLESILHQHKYKNLNQWPLIFPQMSGKSRSRSPPGRPEMNKVNSDILSKLNLTSPRSVSTTSINKVSTVTTVEKKVLPKAESRKSSFSRMFGKRPKSLLLNGGNIELTNSMILLTDQEDLKNRIMFKQDISEPRNGNVAEINTELIRIPKDEWSSLKNKNNELFVENRELAKDNKMMSEEVQYLKRQVSNLMVDLDSHKTQLQKYNEQEALIDRLNNENSDLNQEITNTFEELQQVQSQLDAQTKEAQDKDLKVKTAEDHLQEALQLAQEHKKETDQAHNDLYTNQKELSDVYRKFDKSETRLKTLTKEFEKVTQENEKLKQLNNDNSNIIESLKANNNEKLEAVIKDLEHKIKEKDDKIISLEKDIRKTQDSLRKAKDDYSDISAMKNDLLANMQSKEADIVCERKANTEEVNRLKARIEELEDNEDTLETINKELASKNSSLINMISQLLDTNNNFEKKLRELSTFLLANFKLICSCFEAVGLLITKGDSLPDSIFQNNDMSKIGDSFINGKSDDKGLKIIRVRGLRNKNKSKEDMPFDKPVTPLLKEVEDTSSWIGTTDLTSPTQENYIVEESQNGSSIVDIEKIESEAKTVIDSYNNNAAFEKRYFDFISSVVMDYNVIYASISKRFGDIEHLAKKLQKESKTNKEEILKLLTETRNKIAMKHFKVGDLVLFLPTRDTNVADSQSGELANQPWAAFNIGSPHYFLKETNKTSLANRDWVVSRILSISEHKITAKNYNKPAENPFSLSQGVTWYLIDAKEELSESAPYY